MTNFTLFIQTLLWIKPKSNAQKVQSVDDRYIQMKNVQISQLSYHPTKKGIRNVF